MKKRDTFLTFCQITLVILSSIMLYSFITFEYAPSQITYEEQKPLTYPIKDIDIYVKDVVRKNYSNVLKKDKYYIETNGNNCYSKLFITEEIFNYLKNNLKEPGMVKFTCKTINGSLDGINYNDYVIEIKDIIKQ